MTSANISWPPTVGILPVSVLYNPRHPSFLRLLRQIVDEAHKRGKWVGLCGEMGGQTQHLPVLVGLGLDEISMGASQIPAISRSISRLRGGPCRQLLAAAIACRSDGEVSAMLSGPLPSLCESNRPLLECELILMNSDSGSKGRSHQGTDRRPFRRRPDGDCRCV